MFFLCHVACKNVACACKKKISVFVFSLCSSPLSQNVCHSPQRLQTNGKPIIHPFLSWTFTGIHHPSMYCIWLQLMHIIFLFIFFLPKSVKILRLAFRLVDIKVTFQLNGINLQTVRLRELPDCYAFYITVRFQPCLLSS